MKVLKLIPHCFPAWAYGGTPRMVYEAARALVQRGHIVTILATDAFDGKSRTTVERNPVHVEGIRVFYLRNVSNWLAWNHNFSTSPGLVRVLRREVESCDMMHMHEVRTWENIVGHHYASRMGVPYVISTHGSLLRIVAKRGLKQLYDCLFGYRLLRGADRLIASSQGEADRYPVVLDEAGLSESSQRRIVVIPNWIDPQDFTEMPPREEFRREHNIGDDEKVILFLGRLHAVKRLHLLLDAFIGLCGEDSSLRLVLAGPDEGEEHHLRKRSLQAGLDERVLFPGILTAAEKLAALSSADILVHASRSETLPLSVLEACASSLPVVVTRGCNIPEVEDYQAGFVVGDSKEELQTAMQRILENPGLQRVLGDHGRKMVLETFSRERGVAQLEEVYGEVIAERERPRNLLGR